MLTLLEQAKQARDEIVAAIIELFPRTSPILENIPFDDIMGGGLRYDLEETLPGIGFRGINEGYTASVGVINPAFEPLVIAGGELDVDNHLLRTQGQGRRASETTRKVKALALKWTQTFIKGDHVSAPRAFDGLQNRLVNDQVISAGAGSGGAAVSLLKVDELIDAVDNPTHLICNKKMGRYFTKAARDTAVGGHIEWTTDSFGRQVQSYNGLPILRLHKDNLNADIMPFTEVADSGPNTATSIYCVSFTSDHVHGIQSGNMMVDDLGDLKTQPMQRTRVEWDCGVVVRHPEGAARLQHCGDAVFVA